MCTLVSLGLIPDSGMDAAQRHQRCFIAGIIIIIATGLTACQPLSTKRQQHQQQLAAQKSSEHSSNPTADESTNQSSAADTAQSTMRRKLPTLREQMEKLQNQQDAMNLRLDSVQTELRAIHQKVDENGNSPSRIAKKIEQESEPTKGDSRRNQSENTTPTQKQLSSVPGSRGKTIEPDTEESGDDGTKTSKARSGVGSPTTSSSKRPTKKSQFIQPDNAEEQNIAQQPKRKASRKATSNSAATTQTAESTPRSQQSKTATKESVKEIPVQAENKTATDKVQSTPQLFTTAMSLFSKRQYQETIDVLTQNMAQDKSADNQARSQYWIGESYYGLGKYDEAIRALKAVAALRNAEKSGKAELMIAESYIRLGNTAEAKRTYQRIQKQFPQTEEAVRAAKRLQQL